MVAAMTVATRSTWQAGRDALPELFEGRSQLLIYHPMYGESCARGACQGGSNHRRRDVEGCD
jgi:predicted dithiol-disulfide oxidoreductase (DUF899 family)